MVSKRVKKKHALQEQERTSQQILQEKYTPVLKKCKADSQNYKIMLHLINRYSITQKEAADIYRCYRLSARIHDLRTYGADIETELIPSSIGLSTSSYARYYLKEHANVL